MFQSQLSKAMPTVTFLTLEESIQVMKRMQQCQTNDVDALLRAALSVRPDAVMTAASGGFGLTNAA